MERIEDVVLFRIEQTSKRAKQYAQRVMDQHDMKINVEQWIILKIIHEHSGLTQRELAHTSTRDAASITRSLDVLERRGLLARVAVTGDRRSHSLTLTAQGEQFVKDHSPLIQRLRKQSTQGLSSTELQLLDELLRKIQSNFS